MFGFAVCVQYACPVSHCQGQMSLAHHPYTVDLENLSGFTHLRFVRDRRHNGNSEKPQLASWNANGIKSRIVEVRDFIDKHHSDVFLIQESHLGPGDSIHFPNYTVYRTDRPHTTNTRPRGSIGNFTQVFPPLPPHTDTADGNGGSDFGHSPHPEATHSVITSLYISPAAISTFTLDGKHTLSPWQCFHHLRRFQRPPYFPLRIVTTDWAAFRELLSPAHYTFHLNHCAHGGKTSTQVADHRRDHKTHALSSKPIRGRNSYYVSDEIRQLHDRVGTEPGKPAFTRDPSDKRVLNKYSEIEYTGRSKPSKQDIWEDESRASIDDGSLWEMSKELRKKKSPVYALNGQGGSHTRDSDKKPR
ncbi:hypothetical protein TNCV_4600191 [Trichonephila clavipes]|nr:hypothetical protein TNCV_4600191 [Trichonephila clavipes]